MALLGNIIKRPLKIQEQFRLKNSTPRNYQLQQLNRLLKEANQTAFGQHFQFKKVTSQTPNAYLKANIH